MILCHPPGLDFITAFFGCLMAGVTAVPAYPPPPAHFKQESERLNSKHFKFFDEYDFSFSMIHRPFSIDILLLMICLLIFLSLIIEIVANCGAKLLLTTALYKKAVKLLLIFGSAKGTYRRFIYSYG